MIDQQSDKSQATLLQAIDNLEDSSFGEKVMGMVSELTKTATERSKFALPTRNIFPVDTLEDTVLSKLYFEHQREKLAEYEESIAEKNLDLYLNLYDVPESYFTFKPQVKEAQAEEKIDMYMLPSCGLCKVANEVDLEKAGSLFGHKLENLTVPQRVEYAQQFMKAASELGVTEYPQEICKYAGQLDTDFENLQYMLEIRAAAASRSGQDGSEYTKLASAVGQVEEPPTQDQLIKLAETIYDLDKEKGLDTHKKISCAYSAVFNKEAEDEVNNTTTTLTKSEIVAQYGDDALDAVTDDEGNIDQDKLRNLKAQNA